jgi:hypothetical protein
VIGQKVLAARPRYSPLAGEFFLNGECSVETVGNSMIQSYSPLAAIIRRVPASVLLAALATLRRSGERRALNRRAPAHVTASRRNAGGVTLR